MTIYESELALVKKRLEDINNEKSRPGDKVFVIASGDPVLEEFKDEYSALKRMKEILENNFQQAEDYEYLNARKITKLPKLAAGMEERFAHSLAQENEQNFNPSPAPAPAPAPAPVQSHKLTQEEIERILGGDLGSNPEPPAEPIAEINNPIKPEPAPAPAPAPAGSEQQQDNLIYLTPDQLEKLVSDAVTKALAQINLGSNTQTPTAPESEQPPLDPTQQGPEQNPNPGEPPEQVPDLTPEQEAAMAQAMLNGVPEHNNDDDDLEPIVKVSKWQWIKNHKKPILIALGITAMALTVVLGLHNIFPALKVIENSQELANLGGQMLENSKLASLGVDHLSLHSANTALAEQITEMSQIKHTFDAASGTWTFGTKGLQDFVTSQLAKAAAAEHTVSTIKAAMTAGGITSFGLLGTGLIMPRAKSQEFKDIAKEIKEYPNNIEFSTNNELDARHNALESKINESTTLKNWEKKKLLKKLKKAQKNVDYEIQYRDDPNFEAGTALGDALSEPAGRSL